MLLFQNDLAKNADKASRVVARALKERDYYMSGNIDSLHLVSNPPVFDIGGCKCGCAPAFQFYLDEDNRLGIFLPLLYESNLWHDDE